MALILLSGRPGAGKRETGRWLATEHCYVHVETDVEWATWGQALCTADILAGATTVRNRARVLGPDVVIEWGFRVKLLPCVRQLRMVGFETWWLDGDEGAARQVYLQRRGTSADVIQAYEAQVQSIEAARRRLDSFYEHRMGAVMKVHRRATGRPRWPVRAGRNRRR